MNGHREHALHRYEELVAVHLHRDLSDCIKSKIKQGRVILAIDGVPPDVGHEVRMSSFVK